MLPNGKKLGGAPLNLIYHAINSGVNGAVISSIGNDENGKLILKEIENKKIPFLFNELNYPTGTVDVKLEKGIPSYTIVENVAWDYIELTKEAIENLKNTKVFCYGTLAVRNKKSFETLKEAIYLCSKDALKFYDINLRPPFYKKETIEQLLKLCDVLKINDEELSIVQSKFVNKNLDVDGICHYLMQKFNIKILILTAGDKYSKVYTKENISYIGTPKTKVVDTVGAGDAFSGAFLAKIIQGKTINEAHEYAVQIASFVVEHEGACPIYE